MSPRECHAPCSSWNDQSSWSLTNERKTTIPMDTEEPSPLWLSSPSAMVLDIFVKPQKKRVNFDRVIGVREVKHINDMERDEIEQLWYTPHEYRAIRESIRDTAQRLKQQHTRLGDSCDSDAFCSIGLGELYSVWHLLN